MYLSWPHRDTVLVCLPTCPPLLSLYYFLLTTTGLSVRLLRFVVVLRLYTLTLVLCPLSRTTKSRTTKSLPFLVTLPGVWCPPFGAVPFLTPGDSSPTGLVSFLGATLPESRASLLSWCTAPMTHKLATSRPAWAVETSDNSRRLDGDGGRTAGTPPAGVGAVGASGNHACEIPLRQASSGVPGAPTARRRRKVFISASPSAQTSGPKKAGGHPSSGPEGVAKDSPTLKLKQRTFRFGTWNMLGRKYNSPHGLTPKFLFADDLLALEKLDILALQETHCDSTGPPKSRRSITLAHSGISRLAAGVALISPANSSWSCTTSHVLVPGHALLAQLHHRVSTETLWVLCAYADSS